MPTPTAVLLHTDFIVITLEHDGKIVRYRRTSVPFPKLESAKHTYDQVLGTYDRLGRRGRGLLVDSRDAVGRNDPEFEELLVAFRNRAVPGFAAHVVLMRTSVGLLQAQRIDRRMPSQGSRPAHMATDNEQEAIRFLLQHVQAWRPTGPSA